MVSTTVMDILNKCTLKSLATTVIFLFFHILLLINLSQAHSDCLFILGNAANNVYKESLAKKILNEELPDFDEKAATFRLLTKDPEKWKSLLSEEEQALMRIEQRHNALTLTVVYQGTDEMSLKEITLLSQLIQYAKHFALVEIGTGATVQTVTLLLNTAHCTHSGTLRIDSPNIVFLCNHISFHDVPLLEPKSIVQNFEFPAKIQQRKHKNTAHPAHTRRDMHYTIQQDAHEGVKHKRRRSTKQKIEEIKTLAKRARRHHAPEKIMELPITQKKLFCKYRKSCYETGVVQTVQTEFSTEIYDAEELKPEAEEHEVSDAEIKLVCKYRKSCYEEFGTQAEKKKEPKKHRVLTGKARSMADKGRKKRTFKEIANKALEQVKNQEMKRNQLPEPKKIIREKKVNVTETKKLQMNCKYRKSCYETGKTPEIYSKYYIPIKLDNILPDIYKELKRKNFTELDEFEKKTFCHYRKSCYDTGIKPSMKNATQLKIEHVIKKEEQEIPLQIRCKYRKSCYGTKIPPVIEPIERKLLEYNPPHPVIETLEQLKIHCRYRKSCYQKKLDEHEREEFLKNMEKTEMQSDEEVKVGDATEVSHESDEIANDEILNEIVPRENFNRTSESEIQKHQDEVQKSRTEKKTPNKNEHKKETSKKNEQGFKARMQKTAGSNMKKGNKASTTSKVETGEHTTQEFQPTVTRKEKGKKASIEKRIKTTDGKLISEKAEKRKDRKFKERVEVLEPANKSKQSKKDEINETKQKTNKQEKDEVEEQENANKEQNKEEFVYKPTVTVDKIEEEISKVETAHPFENFQKDRVYNNNHAKLKKKTQDSQPTANHSDNESVTNYENNNEDNDTNVNTIDQQILMNNEELIHDGSNDSTDTETDVPAKTFDHKLSCKYRKSCYSKGKKYISIKNIHQKPKGKKHTELTCKYRKSCYETGKKPEIKAKLFTPMEDLVRKFYSAQVDSEKPVLNEQNRKLFCKYRKSCYATGKLPVLKPEHLKTLAVTKADAVNTQLRCKYRKSCYQNSNIVLDKKTEKLKNAAKREVVNVETQDGRQPAGSFKYTDEKRKGTTEKKVKKDDHHHDDESEDDESVKKKNKRRNKDDNVNDKNEKLSTEKTLYSEQIYKQIQDNETDKQSNNGRTFLNTKDKLNCKYRKRCYDGLDPTTAIKLATAAEPSKHKAAQLISMKGLMRPNGKPCSIYYISCRKLVGLPIRQRPPIGPNGKRLCRKKPKTTSASNI